MTPTYNIVPGDRVGPFKLGESLWSILELLRTEKTTYPKVEISWDQSQAHKSPISIHIPQIILTFQAGPTQSLIKITTTGLNSPLFTLKYDTYLLCAPATRQKLTRGLIGKILGPTYDTQGSSGKLEYPGIEFQVGGKKGVSGDRDEVVESLVVKPKDGEVESETILTRCTILPGIGVTLQFGSSPPVEVILGQTTHQDLLSDLGTPLRRFWKEDERMEKMWGGTSRNEEKGSSSSQGDSFLNYLQYGLDLLISSDGIVKKIIAYSNIPGSPLFQRYAKCPWILSDSLTSSSPISNFHTTFSTSSNLPPIISPTPEPSGNLAVPPKRASKRSGSASSGRPSKVDMAIAAKSVEIKGEVQGMTLDRIGEGGLEGVKGEMRSRLVGFEGLVVEEDLTSRGISSVLIYQIER